VRECFYFGGEAVNASCKAMRGSGRSPVGISLPAHEFPQGVRNKMAAPPPNIACFRHPTQNNSIITG